LGYCIGAMHVFHELHKVRGRFIKPGVSPGERRNRLRQHGTLFIFFTKIFAQSAKIFVKKHRIFRPAGGESGCLSRQTPARSTTA
jgi:hypothetical protein